MNKVKIMSDSTCDLSEDLLKKYDIKTFPLHVIMGEKEYLDGVNITPEDIYKWSDENKITPKTSAISPLEAQTYIKEALEDNEEVVCFTLSSDFSSTCSVMHMAAVELEVEERFHVIDSRNLSTGIGLLVIEAAIMANQGMSAKDIVNKVNERVLKVKSSFVVDTLTYLYRGGRCSGVASLAGNSLKLHPSIYVENGKLSVGKFYRGKMNKVLSRYVDDMNEALKNANKDRIFITHSGCDQEVIETIENQLLLMNFKEVLIIRAGSAITCHCGPGTLGVLYIEE